MGDRIAFFDRKPGLTQDRMPDLPEGYITDMRPAWQGDFQALDYRGTGALYHAKQFFSTMDDDIDLRPYYEDIEVDMVAARKRYHGHIVGRFTYESGQGFVKEDDAFSWNEPGRRTFFHKFDVDWEGMEGWEHGKVRDGQEVTFVRLKCEHGYVRAYNITPVLKDTNLTAIEEEARKYAEAWVQVRQNETRYWGDGVWRSADKPTREWRAALAKVEGLSDIQTLDELYAKQEELEKEMEERNAARAEFEEHLRKRAEEKEQSTASAENEEGTPPAENEGDSS